MVRKSLCLLLTFTEWQGPPFCLPLRSFFSHPFETDDIKLNLKGQQMMPLTKTTSPFLFYFAVSDAPFLLLLLPLSCLSSFLFCCRCLVLFYSPRIFSNNNNNNRGTLTPAAGSTSSPTKVSGTPSPRTTLTES